LARQRERLRAVVARLMEVEETQRRSLNRELHDSVGRTFGAAVEPRHASSIELGNGAPAKW
jgi:glucose-6-phosphate-specific signal transduction histidine kinase